MQLTMLFQILFDGYSILEFEIRAKLYQFLQVPNRHCAH